MMMGSRVAIRQAPDGSIEREDGRILQFSVKRFVRDISAGQSCLICGRHRNTVPFNDEHVLPDWILRRFRLHSRSIRLPSDTGFRYGRYKVPCCQSCNDEMGTELERPIREMLTGGYPLLTERLRDEGTSILFSWLAFLYLKTHFRDLTLRFDRDHRSKSPAIGELYEWEALHHIHCVARSVHTRARLGKGVIGSLLVLPADITGPFERFDYGDLYIARTVLIRLDDICVVAVLNDGCAALCAYRDKPAVIGGPLSPIQLREIMVRLAYLNVRLVNRPQFYSDIDARGSVAIGATLPDMFDLKEGKPEEFGRLFYESVRDIIDGVANHHAVRDKVLSGTFTFLRDDSGNFNTKSMEFCGGDSKAQDDTPTRPSK